MYRKSGFRIATMLGFIMSVISFLVALVYLIMKLVNWYDFQMGTAPILIGMFLLASIQLAFIGVIGEYVGAILTRVTKRPMIIEEERINFDDTDEVRKNYAESIDYRRIAWDRKGDCRSVCGEWL